MVLHVDGPWRMKLDVEDPGRDLMPWEEGYVDMIIQRRSSGRLYFRLEIYYCEDLVFMIDSHDPRDLGLEPQMFVKMMGNKAPMDYLLEMANRRDKSD